MKPEGKLGKGSPKPGGLIKPNLISVGNKKMASPLRIECVGGLYHMTSKGNAHEVIYADDDDRIIFLQ